MGIKFRTLALAGATYNAEPDADAIAVTVDGGLVNARALHGLGGEPTFRSTGSRFLAPSADLGHAVAPKVSVSG